MPKVAGCAVLLAAVFLVASCSGSSGSSAPAGGRASAPPQSSSGSQSISPTPKIFTSATYGYTVSVPPEWSSIQAVAKWDGQAGLNIESAEVDHFGGDSPGVWAVATSWKRDLTAYTRFWITWTARNHGDTCPFRPDTRHPITIGGQSGMLIAYNCGILINYAITIHGGVGYCFVLRDGAVDAATDPTDYATFAKMLSSVQFP
jgi:hypothetical protein